MKRLGSLFLVILVSFMLVGCSKENTNVSQDDTLNLIQDGLIAVNKDGDWGYVDEEGSIVIDLTYQGAGMFMNGVAVVV
ncbi:MAG: WG repeat-containing protein, partial [Candidatus Izimaplasma sp.]|nr:WG repeat-containing protein [Candidatus Izimaplasma bacterium]